MTAAQQEDDKSHHLGYSAQIISFTSMREREGHIEWKFIFSARPLVDPWWARPDTDPLGIDTGGWGGPVGRRFSLRSAD